MTQKDKELLLKDLCARVPYGVQMNHVADNEVSPDTLIGINGDYVTLQGAGGYSYVPVEHYKPYLFPISSMTEEQKEEYCQLQQKIIYNSKGPVNTDIMNYINWCYKNHLDIKDLISLGSAIDATGLNIY